jgi:HD-like signal output (HDOD) protein
MGMRTRQKGNPVQILVIGGDRGHVEAAGQDVADHGLGWHLAWTDAPDALLAGDGDVPDVVVCAGAVGRFDGLALLGEVRTRHPEAVRILLMDQGGDRDVFQALETSHRIVAEPLDALSLIEAVEGVIELRTLLDDPMLKQAIERVGTLPAAPKQYLALVRLLRDPDSTAARIAEVVGQDPTLAARVLRLSNSAYYSGGREISDLRSAVTRLGHEALRQLVLASEVFSSGPDADVLRDRALRISQLAGKLLAGPSSELASTAGLLAEVGLLLPRTEGDATGGASYATTGAYLLGLWGLPGPIVEAVAFHDRPGRVHGSFWVTGAVHVAAALVNGRDVDEAYLRSVGQLDRLPRWRALADAAATVDAG